MVISLEDKTFWSTCVRKIDNKGLKKHIGKFPSLKMGRNIWFESILECDYIHLLEIDTNVVRFKEQPFRIRYTFNGRRYSYVPDFFVQRKNKLQAVEVKPSTKATTEKNIIRFRLIRSICLLQGYEFFVATEKEIRIEPVLENVKTFLRYARTPIHPLHQVYCQEFLSKRQESSLQELADSLAARGVTLQVLYALLYWGVLSADMYRPVSPDTVVRFACLTVTARSAGERRAM